MATRTQDQMFRRDVRAWSDMLHDDPILEDLRKVLRRKHVDPMKGLLAAFCENGDGTEFGVVITDDGRVIEYSRRIALSGRGSRLIQWRDRTGDKDLIEQCPHIPYALGMARADKRA